MSNAYLVPPSVATPVPFDLPSGTVRLMADPNWSSAYIDCSTGNYVEGKQYSIVGTSLNDKATWIAFNLPAGTVMTWLQNPTSNAYPYDFANAGVCVDLIGNGAMQTVDLKALGANDTLSAFVWRQVNMDAGVFQLFDNTGCTGNRNTFFLGEWPRNTINTLDNWWICDRAASAYFTGLSVQSFTLFDGGNGGGANVTYAGWLQTTRVDSLLAFKDKAASWSWSLLTPIFSVVQPFTMTAVGSNDPALSLVSTITGVNDGAATITDKVTVSSADAQSLTLSVTDTTQIGYVESVKFTYSTMDIFTDSVSFEINCSFSQTYTYAQSKSTTKTETITLTVEQDIVVPADSSYVSTLNIQLSEIPATKFTTQGQFYYDQPVPGSVYDADASAQFGRSIYLLNAPVTGSIGGGVAFNTISSTQAVPLSSAS